jgi:hypothetical protein
MTHFTAELFLVLLGMAYIVVLQLLLLFSSRESFYVTHLTGNFFVTWERLQSQVFTNRLAK